MTTTMEMAGKPVVLLGAGGHAKVLLDLLQQRGCALLGVCDPMLREQGVAQWRGLPVLGGDEALGSLDPRDVELVNGVGQLVANSARKALYQRMRGTGFRFPALVHPRACVAGTAQLSDGVQVMAGAVVQADAFIGENTIINTRAAVDHDCRIGAHVHVAPSATLCGGVHVEEAAFLGAACTCLPGVRVGAGAVVGAGVTLADDLAPGTTHYRVAGQQRENR